MRSRQESYRPMRRFGRRVSGINERRVFAPVLVAFRFYAWSKAWNAATTTS